MSRNPLPVDLKILAAALDPHGLILRGGFPLEPTDDPGEGTLIMVGNAGRAMWDAFAGQAGAGANPLDAWTRTVVEPVAGRFGARAIYPFDTPHPPFQQWAKRAEGLASSPLGILIHPRFGLWHAYRAALLFPFAVAGFDAAPGRPEIPCDSCDEKPCLTACPVDAFSPEGYNVTACAGHLAADEGRACRETGCAARNACPVGQDYRYSEAQTRFHMAAFTRSVTGA